MKEPSATGCGFILSSSVSSYRALEQYCEEKAPSKVMKLASKQLSLWVAFGCLIGAIAIEEDVGTTRLLEAETTTTTTTTTTSPTTVTEPFTSTPSTTTTTTTATSTTIPNSTTTSSTSAVPILARANPISSSSTVRSILSTASGTSGTTAKPSAKRQISLSEFQQLVAKVNDEISMLRNQSANLSQTYEELVRRYNERTSQIPIVLYDVTECSNSSTGPAERLSDTTEKSTQLSTIVTATVSNGTETTAEATTTTERTTTTTTLETTTTTSTTAMPPPSTRWVDYSPPKLVPSELYRDQASLPDAVPPNTGSSHTQIYGNKYYNYIHYFMYPPNEAQLEELHNPFSIGHRRKDGNDPRRAPPRRRPPYEKTKHRWEESIDSQEEEEESEFDVQQSSAALRRNPSRRRKPTGELRSNVRLGTTDRRAPLRSPAGPVETYSFDSKPIGELRSNLRFGSTDPRAPVKSPAGLAEPFAYDSKRTGELRTNIRLGSTDPRVPFGGPSGSAQPYPYGDSYRAGPVPQRQPIEPTDFLPPAKIPQFPSFPERIPPRISPPQEQFSALKLQTVPPESAPIAPPKKDALTAFLERRKLNRNGSNTVAVPAKLATPSTTTSARAEAVTPPSVESLFTFGAKPVSYAIPTTAKPSLGVVRNGWDANDFSFIRKAQESKKRLQRERRSWGARLRDL
ncbi:nuclear pore complex protein DDB_G0274915-like [Anopheles merus]|uniref:nuclear pore complex protein DDB_G0274915-like n=1 Tax=Anopheles merus TaxID=30066 RepID=UPI001BE49CCF|nr:nuclear pore complex protein DDB_G0274915-like [Anopheles merus]